MGVGVRAGADHTVLMVKRPTTRELGLAAEARAAAYLEGCGLEILARNVRCRVGELDLVCLDGEALVIVEVRERASADFGGALGSVTLHKQRKLVRAALYYWQRNRAWRARALRFDVVALEKQRGAQHIEWIKDAFRAA
jgi:putative endonuclease